MITKEVTLQILAKDFYETDYYDSDDCVITRALHRVGLTHLHDAGTDIIDNRENVYAAGEDYKQLASRVVGMYFYLKKEDPARSCNYTPECPKDFEATIAIKFLN
jgi:hypothetical protein